MRGAGARSIEGLMKEGRVHACMKGGRGRGRLG